MVPEISKEEFVKLLKGFVDMLILASGFQSSGAPAHWDADNCRKALQWGLFFQNVAFTLCSHSHSHSQSHYLFSLFCLSENPFVDVKKRKHLRPIWRICERG